MISHEHKCIFVHIPKCAGTSIERALGHFDDYSGRGRQDHRSIRMIEPINSKIFASVENNKEFIKRLWVQASPPPNPRSRFVVTKEQYESYFKFTIVRNPWARAYSWYKNVLKDDLWKRRYKITGEMTLYEFLKLYIGVDGLRPQIFWIKNYNGDITLDYIGRFENLANNFQTACNLMKIEPIKLPHELKGNANDYIDAYDANSRDIINKVFREEIELFGYSFGT